MRICRIEIEEFGRLQNFCLTPGKGVTLIEGANESGKSTLLAFLRFVLYGFPPKRGRDGDEREKRLSWQTGRAVGSLTLEWQGSEYRILRRCVGRGTGDAVAEELSVIRLPQGDAVALGGKSPGEYFLGLPAELYDGSLCLIQSDAARVSTPGMGDAVGDLLFTGDAAYSAESAERRLQDARRELQHLKGGGGRIALLESELAQLDGDIANAAEQGETLSRLREEQATCNARIEEHRRQLLGVAGAFARAEIDRTLALFERRRALLELMTERERELRQMALDVEAALPDAESLAQIEKAVGESEGAQGRIDALTPLRERLAQTEYDEELLRGAALLEREGGARALSDRVKKHAARRKGRRAAGVLCLLLCGAALAVGHWLTAWQRYAVLGGAVAALLGVLLLCGSLADGARVRRRLRAVGVKSVSLLEAYAEQCLREAQTHRANGEQLAETEAALTEAMEARERATLRLRELLTSLGHGDVLPTRAGVTELLAALLRRKNEWQAAMTERTVDCESARSAVKAYDAQLAGKDEQALRARRAVLPCTDAEDEETLTRRRTLLEQMIGALEQKREELARSEAALVAVAKDKDALLRRRESAAQELAAAKTRLAALHLALETLAQAEEELKGSLLPRLCTDAAARFHELTGGVHGEMHLNADLGVLLVGEGIPRPISHYSAGCRDAAHLALRMALIEGVCATRPPLLFDEAFARLDDGRALNLLRAILAYCRAGGQAILLTCHGRERRFLAEESDVTYAVMPK